MRQTKADKLADRRIQRAVGGIQINIMDIGKVSALGRRLIDQGVNDAELAGAFRAFVAAGCPPNLWDKPSP
jgi:hypothetical protein